MDDGRMKPTILVVDDDEDVRKLLQEALANDYDIVLAGEGFEGLSEVMVGEKNIDLIITDLHMPGLDGIEFVKGLPEGIPFIIISGFLNLLKFREAMKGLHPVAVFEKPFRIHALLQAVHGALPSPG